MPSVTKPEFSGRPANVEWHRERTRPTRKAESASKTEDAQTEATSSMTEEANAVDRTQQAEQNDKVTRAQPSVQETSNELAKALGLDQKSTRLEFNRDEDLDRVIVRVVDRDTDEVLREIPPEEVLRVAKAMRELNESADALKGNLVQVVT